MRSRQPVREWRNRYSSARAGSCHPAACRRHRRNIRRSALRRAHLPSPPASGLPLSRVSVTASRSRLSRISCGGFLQDAGTLDRRHVPPHRLEGLAGGGDRLVDILGRSGREPGKGLALARVEAVHGPVVRGLGEGSVDEMAERQSCQGAGFGIFGSEGHLPTPCSALPGTDLVGGFRQPFRIDLDPPARGVGHQRMAIGDVIRRLDIKVVLPGVVVFLPRWRIPGTCRHSGSP